MQKKAMVPAEASMDAEVEHRLAPVVAGQELASAVIQDTVKYLGIQATGISNLNGPYLQVRPVGNNASDILLVGSWRAHFPPGGDASGPKLDSLQPAFPKPSPSALLWQTSGSDATQSLPEEAPLARASSLTTPAAAAAAAADAGGAPGDQCHVTGDSGFGNGGDATGAMVRNNQLRQQEGPQSVTGKQAGPIIEECVSDSEARAPEANGWKANPDERHRQVVLAGASGSAVAAAADPDPDRMMEDAPASHQATIQQRAGGQQFWDAGHEPGGARPVAAAESNGSYTSLEGPGLTVAGALALAAAVKAAANGSPRSPAVVASTRALVMSPRPRSEWELDPAKIAVGRRLAVGGFGEVFLAKYEGTLVAVKRLLATDSDTTQRFLDEVHMLARLRHPNLLLFMGYTLTPEPSIVTEFMARGSLFHILRQAGNRPPEIRMQRAVAVAVARGMAYLHSRIPPILHLDLKSPNVLVDDRWRVKIADFGLSRVRQRTYVSSGAAAGSPEWMAPEVLRCDHYAEAADVYSYGVILWELLTGQAPWADLNAMQVVGAVGFAKRSLPDPQEGDPVLLHLCMSCRAYEPSQRPTFAQVVQALEAHCGPPAAPSGHPSAAMSGTQAAMLPTGPQTAAAAEAERHRLPALPAPEPGPVPPPPPERPSLPGPSVDARIGGGAATPLAIAASTRITRRHSLAASPDASELLGAAAGGSSGGGLPGAGAAGGSMSTGGGPPPRLDARFVSMHESPRSRRRYRSPRGEEMVGPPAITARLQDGRKTPSPRTSGGWAWQSAGGGASAKPDVQAPPQPAAAPCGVRLMPASASPFAAAAAAADPAPDSARMTRKPRVDPGRFAPAGSDAGSVDSGIREVGTDGAAAVAVAVAEPQSMDLGSPPTLAAPLMFSRGPPVPLADSKGQAQTTGAEIHQRPLPPLDAGPAAAADAAISVERRISQHGIDLGGRPQGQFLDDTHPHDRTQEVPQHRHPEAVQSPGHGAQAASQTGQQLPQQTQQLQPVSLEQSVPDALQQLQQQQQEQRQSQVREQQQQSGQIHEMQAAAGGHGVAAHGAGAPQRPGHRRVSSDEASRLPSNMSSSVGTAGAGQLQQHQQRPFGQGPSLGGAAAAGSGGMPPVPSRRSRGLARNSAPMRYTYGGASSGGPAAQQQLHPMQSPQRPRSFHGPVHLHHANMHQQVLTANAEAAMGSALHGMHLQGQSAVSTPGTPGGGGGGSNAAMSGSAALSAPMSLSPLSDGVSFFDPAGPRSLALAAELRDREIAMGAVAGAGADPWPDNHSELSFAFILRDNVSICSDDCMQSASLDRLPLLEESEMTDPAADDSDANADGDAAGVPEGGAGDAISAAEAHRDGLATIKADGDFELPRPFLSADQPALRTATVQSPFAADPNAQLPGAASGAKLDSAAAAPEADLWAALQGHGSAGLGRGAAGDWVTSQADGAHGSSAHLHRISSGGAASAKGPAGLQLAGVGPQPDGALPHSRDGSRGSAQLQEDARPKAEGDQPVRPRNPSGGGGGGGATTYRTGRFKVTIEPASSGPPPPQSGVPLPNQHLQQPCASQLQHFLSLPSSTTAGGGGAFEGLRAVASASTLATYAAGAEAPSHPNTAGDGLREGIPPPLVVPVGNEAAVVHTEASPAIEGPIGSGDGAGANGSACALQHGGGGCAAAACPLGESPGSSSSRLRGCYPYGGYHSHGNLHGDLAAGPPVALNSVTMYRKGRFFVSHAAVGTHSLSVINPNAPTAAGTSAHAAGSGGCSATDSLAEESEEHDAGSGPPSPFASIAAATAPFGRAASHTGMDGLASLGLAAKPSWPAASALACSQDSSWQGHIPRQYSRGRFTVAESIVSAPSADLRRPASCSAGGDPPALAADLVWAPKPPSTAVMTGCVSAASPPLGGHTEGHVGVHHGFASADDIRGGGSFLKRAPVLHPHLSAAPAAARAAPAPLQTAQAVQHGMPGPDAAGRGLGLTIAPGAAGGSGGGAKDADGSGGGAGGGAGESAPGTAPPSPRAEQMVVRRVGRFTVRELDCGSNGSSRCPSHSGTPADPIPTVQGNTAVSPGGAAVTGAAAGATAICGGGIAGHTVCAGAGGCQGRGSPPEEGMVPSSHHSSCSFASASGCSRSSSASHGLDGDLAQPQGQPLAPPAAHATCAVQPQPQSQHQSRQQQVPQAQQPPSKDAPMGALPKAVEEPPAERVAEPPHDRKILQVKSKGRFTVIDYSAPSGPVPPLQVHQCAAFAYSALGQPAGGLDAGGSVPGPPTQMFLSGWPQQQLAGTADPQRPQCEVLAGAAGCGSGAVARLHAGQGSSAHPIMAAEVAAADHGGVLHPPPGSLQGSAGPGDVDPQRGVAAVLSASADAAALRAQADRAQLQADMERLVRERMERNAQEQQQQQRLRQRLEQGGRHRLARLMAAQQQHAEGGAEEQQLRGVADGEAGRGGDRCMYEVSFGGGLTIQISHGLQAVAGEGEGEEDEEDEDAVMVDVGIMHGDAADGGDSDTENDGEGEVRPEDGRPGETDDDELHLLQPPETPAHEPVREPEPARASSGGGRRPRSRRRHSWYGIADSSENEDSMEV